MIYEFFNRKKLAIQKYFTVKILYTDFLAVKISSEKGFQKEIHDILRLNILYIYF